MLSVYGVHLDAEWQRPFDCLYLLVDQFANFDDVEPLRNRYAHGKRAFTVEADDLLRDFHRPTRDRCYVRKSNDFRGTRLTDSHVAHGLHVVKREFWCKPNSPLTVSDRTRICYLVFLCDAGEHRIDRETQAHETFVVYLDEDRFRRFARRFHFGHPGNHFDTRRKLSRHVENLSL